MTNPGLEEDDFVGGGGRRLFFSSSLCDWFFHKSCQTARLRNGNSFRGRMLVEMRDRPFLEGEWIFWP